VGAVSSDPIVVGEIPREPPGFQPRPDLLAELDRTDAGAPAVQLLTGIAGAGKTQLAAAYARAKLAADWRLVAWVNAGTTGALRASLAATAEAARLPGDRDQPDMSGAGHAVRRRLEADGDRCLLIFDGAEDPEALRPFVPTGGAARVLITSTRPAGASWLAGVPVDVFTPEEARAFLAERAERADDAAAAAVAAELGHLPLALALAAAVAVGQQAGYQGCLERLRALPAGEPLAQGESQAPPLGIVQPVLFSLEAVRTADGTGVCTRLMEIMAVLSTAGVCRDLLHDAGSWV
jgi:hypothetical protein